MSWLFEMMWTPEQVAIVLLVGTTGYFVQTVAGFGSMLTMVALGLHVVPLEQLLSVVIPAALLQPSLVVWRDREHIRADVLREHVIPWMGLGLLLGFGVATWLAGDQILKSLLGVFVVLVSLRALWKMRREETPMEKDPSPVWLIGAGVFHGMFTTGGPPLVYTLGGLGLDKRALRGTLACVWLSMNLTLTVLYTWRGTLGAQTLILSAMLMPSVVIGYLIGDWVHTRLPQRVFQVGLYVMLVAAGAALI